MKNIALDTVTTTMEGADTLKTKEVKAFGTRAAEARIKANEHFSQTSIAS